MALPEFEMFGQEISIAGPLFGLLLVAMLFLMPQMSAIPIITRCFYAVAMFGVAIVCTEIMRRR